MGRDNKTRSDGTRTRHRGSPDAAPRRDNTRRTLGKALVRKSGSLSTEALTFGLNQ